MSLETSTRSQILAAEMTGVRTELGRIDAKAGILVSLSGAGLAFVLTAATPKAPLAEKVLLVAAAVALAASALVVLLAVVMPKLGSFGFRRWATQTPDQILESLTVNAHGVERHAAADLGALSQIVDGKFASLRTAVQLLAAAVVLIAAAVLAGVIA